MYLLAKQGVISTNSQTIIHVGNEKYYENLGKDDYYTGEQPNGFFCGSGAKVLSIDGRKIKHQDELLKSLFKGEYEDEKFRKGGYHVRTYHCLNDGKGKEIVLNKYQYNQIKGQDPKWYDRNTLKKLKEFGKEDPHKYLTQIERRSVLGYDNVFSAPKDVSVIWALTEDQELKHSIEQAHAKAVEQALIYLESQTVIRKEAQGKNVKDACAVFAQFKHQVSREVDPQLHDHVVQLNFGFHFTEDGKREVGAICGMRALSARYASGMVYQTELRHRMEKLGFRTFDRPFAQGKGKSFGIEGFPPGLRALYSKRSKEIQKAVKEDMTAKQKRAEVLKTRKDKSGGDIATDSRREAWREEAKKKDFDIERITNTRQKPRVEKFDVQKFNRDVAEKLYIKLAEYNDKNESTNEPNKRRLLSKVQVESAVLSSIPTSMDSEQALEKAKLFIKYYTRDVEFEKTRTIKKKDGKEEIEQYVEKYKTLNEAGIQCLSFETKSERLTRIAKYVIDWHYDFTNFKEFRVAMGKWLKDRKSNYLAKLYDRRRKFFKAKVTFLYATGQVSRKQYLQLTDKVDVSTSVFQNRVKQALGLQSKRQADFHIDRGKREAEFNRRKALWETKRKLVEGEKDLPSTSGRWEKKVLERRRDRAKALESWKKGKQQLEYEKYKGRDDDFDMSL